MGSLIPNCAAGQDEHAADWCFPADAADAERSVTEEDARRFLDALLCLADSLKPEELQVLRSRYEKEGEFVGVQTKFNYAWGLIKSSLRQDQQTGVRLLSEIFRVAPERRRECLYYLALGNYKLGIYAEARRYNDQLLDLEPMNMQASSLKELIDDKVAREGLMGVAILSGVAIAAGVVGGMLFRGVGRKR